VQEVLVQEKGEESLKICHNFITMKKSMIKYLKHALKRMHHFRASFPEVVAVLEKFGGETVWSGVVSVFRLEGHPQAHKCYAWSSPIDGSTKRRYYGCAPYPSYRFPREGCQSIHCSRSQEE
jgi:hypothetical protein